MNIHLVRKLLSELTEKILQLDIERDGILQHDGNKIKEYYDHRQTMYECLYPIHEDDIRVKQKPSPYAQSETIEQDYHILWDLQMASAPARNRLAEIKKLVIGYQKERKELSQKRQDLEAIKQEVFDL